MKSRYPKHFLYESNVHLCFYVNPFSALTDSKAIVVDQDENKKKNNESSSVQNIREGKTKQKTY